MDKELITYLKREIKERGKLITKYEKRGLENLDYEETELYGFWVGSKEMAETILEKLKRLKP